ncbi:chymotrypsin family serine protease [Mycobacteroides abscessus]|uniref:hypothetical protein n=1 Tax=Mycobacteroides abscessus TaxID=36809 RepID=UPI0026702979|nr:hypothetical protein [Mycobacteroides abscessus]MDO3110465.1 hypothetical protein [Mycobacteroides abscessus subsp. abscessus]
MISKTRPRVRVAAAAVAALAAVTVAGCGPSRHGDMAKPWPTATPSPIAAQVTETGGDASASVASIRFRDVTGEVDPPRDTEGAQFGLTPLPGVRFSYYDAANEHQMCSLGPAIVDGFLTAGHCTAALRPTPAELSTSQDAYMSKQVRFGTVTGAADNGGSVDSAAIRGVTVPAAATLIAGRYPVAGVLTRAGAFTLPPATPICLDGAKSGVICSPIHTAAGDYLEFGNRSHDGDSGAAVFVVTPQDQALLIGILSGADSTGKYDQATYIEPVLQRLDAKVLVDKIAAQEFAGDEFSTLVTPR